MDTSLLEKIESCQSLPSLPALAMEVLNLAQKEEVDIGEIARAIAQDPALSSKILKTANSSFYARPQSIGTIHHALVILGLQSVKTLVLGFSLVKTFSKTKPRGFNHLDYWRRSIYSANAAKKLAAKLGVIQQEECFLAALLKDIGMLVMDQVLGNSYGLIHERIKFHDDLCDAELAEHGITHADVSGHMAKIWKLPPVLETPVLCHHRLNNLPAMDPTLKTITEIVWLSEVCADVFVDEEPGAAIARFRRHMLEQHDISNAECDAILDDIGSQTREIAPLFEISIGAGGKFEDILKKANETLVQITLKMQQEAANLHLQNQRLKIEATTDSLTGLANRAALDRFIHEKFENAQIAGRPISLILIDVDHFKKVNDQQGHQIGDQVLGALGKLIKNSARTQDLAARYGGEELMLVMPDTGRSTASAIAESIRRAASLKPFKTDAGTVPITISIGVATWENSMPFKSASHLVKAADLAVYAAKNAGRNCVKVFTYKAA